MLLVNKDLHNDIFLQRQKELILKKLEETYFLLTCLLIAYKHVLLCESNKISTRNQNCHFMWCTGDITVPVRSAVLDPRIGRFMDNLLPLTSVYNGS